ncbi:MAG TPA: hypothetical protein DDZ68_12820 [Parvularcula sp.]|nr:hypothetical protein [Parvularcula sp.]
MIVLRSVSTGELQVVAANEGRYDPAEWIEIGPVPEGVDPHYLIWDGAELATNLDAIRAERRALVDARKAEIQSGGCMTPKGEVQTDPGSRDLIAGAVQMAMIAKSADAPYLQYWTMADDSDVAHDADEMIAMGLAVGEFVGAAHAHARSLKAAIEAAADAAAILAVDIDAGWP